MIRPLTKRRKKDQSLYERPPEIEAEIAVALSNDRTTLRHRLLVTSSESRDYLQSETLVCLLRDAFRSGDETLRDAILVVLLGRCEVILNSRVSRRLPNAAEIREDILSNFTQLLAADAADPNAEALDYYECRFMRALRTLRLSGVKKALKEVNRAAQLPEEVDQAEVDCSEISGRSDFRPVAALFHAQATPENAAYREQVWEALNRLPPKEADAYILVHVMGYDEESDDPSKETAATRLNCTGRTIRNRLEKAERRLSNIISKEKP